MAKLPVNLSHLTVRLKAMVNSGAWILIIIGLLLFAARLPVSADSWINLPVAITMIQTAGLMFTLFGLQIMASMMVWPQLDVSELLDLIRSNSTAAGLALLGILVFNGLCIVGFTIWVSSAMRAGVGG